MTTKDERFTALCLDLIAGEREKCGIAADVRLSVAKRTCMRCGSSVTLAGAACAACGAHGEARNWHQNANRAVFTAPAVQHLVQDTEQAAVDAAYLPAEVSNG